MIIQNPVRHSLLFASLALAIALPVQVTG